MRGERRGRNTGFDESQKVARNESKRIKRSINDSEPFDLVGIQTNSSGALLL